MKCPVCWSEGLSNINFRGSSEGNNGMTYKKYTCMSCNTDYTTMYRLKNVDETLERLIISGQMIAAIKLQRAQTGWGIREAKHFCDNLREKLVRQGKMLGRPTHINTIRGRRR